MADMKTDWAYPVMETTLDKRLEKPGVQRGYSSELTGVDGRSEGGLKPFPGFKLAYTLSQLKNQSGHSFASRVLDFKAIDFRIGSEDYGYGFVYRATRGTTSTCDVFVDYWDSVNRTWTTCFKVMDAVASTGQFDVQVFGKFVYCFLEGRTPSLFYVEASRTKEYDCEADTYLSSATPTTVAPISYEMEVLTGASTKNALMRFDTSAESSKTVEQAILKFVISYNAILANANLHINPVTDPSATGVLWTEAQATWNNRTTASAWSTAGGSYDAAYQTNVSLAKNFLGAVQADVTAQTQRCVSGLAQSFTRKTDLIIRGGSLSALVTIPSRTQANYAIRPKLVVTYTNKTFLTPVVIGLTTGGTIPGPGLQPTLGSPERGVSPGSFNPRPATRPAEAQIVLVSDDPYTTGNNFPDQVSGLCPTDSFTATAAATPPGSSYTHSPSAGACSPSATGVITQLLTPANKQTNVSVTPKLDWTTYYPNGDALDPNVKWDVYMVEEGKGNLSNHRLNTGSPGGLTVTYFEPASLFPNLRLDYGKKYLWKVIAKRNDCADFYVSSSTGSFTTENRYSARKFEPGDYSFGYVLVNSKTGRKSAFSTVAQIRSDDFRVVRPEGGNNITVKQDQYIGVEIVYDSAKYDLMYVYRSVKIQDAGGTMVAGLPFLDGIITLQDYHTCLNGTGRTYDAASTNLRHAMYFYELEDKQLVYQNPYIDRSVFDDKMPFGGAALFHQGTMLVSKIKAPPSSTADERRIPDPVRGLGEMRWSSLMDSSPELFPPFNRYNPTVPSNEVIAFAAVGTNAVGLSRDKVYHLRKSGPYIKVTEMHEGFGVVNHKALVSVGSSVFYVTSHGLKSVDAQGQLDEIRNLNSVITKEWKDNLNEVMLTHDPFMNCLFVHNPTQEETYVLWFSTGKTTKVADANFNLVSNGAWPTNWVSDLLSAGNDLGRRAFFLQNNQDTRASGTGYGVFDGPRIYVVDSYGSKEINGSATWDGARRITTLDFDGDSRFTASGNWDNLLGRIPITLSGDTVVGVDAWKFCYLYLVWSTQNPQNIGKKAKIFYNTTTGVFPQTVGNAWLNATVTGDVFVVSPIVFEWAGHPLGMSDEQGMVYSNADLFRMKVVGSVGASFTDVVGPPTSDGKTSSTPLDRFTGLLYAGTEEVASMTALTKDTSGNLYSSVENDEGMVYAAFGVDSSDGRYGAKGTTLTPGIRILCPDLDFRLLGCIVRGSITTVERTTNIRGS